MKELVSKIKEGDVFTFLTVIKYVGKTKFYKRIWECNCRCGKTKTVIEDNLLRKTTKSCGCWSRQYLKTIRSKYDRTGKKLPGELISWRHMISRCNDPKNNRFKSYGGRGIRVCDRWLNSFSNFLSDMGPKPSHKHSLDRFPDTNGNYDVSNCRWATSVQQAYNKTVNITFEMDGATKCLAEWCFEKKMPYHTVFARLKRGFSFHEAITRPVRYIDQSFREINKRNYPGIK